MDFLVRVEELDGKLEEARNIIAQGCNNCLDSDDIWIETARLRSYSFLFHRFMINREQYCQKELQRFLHPLNSGMQCKEGKRYKTQRAQFSKKYENISHIQHSYEGSH